MSEEEKTSEPELTHLQLIDRSYPGLRRWIEFHKYPEHDGLMIFMYDLDAGTEPVTHVINLAMGYLVNFLSPAGETNAMMCPAFTAAEYVAFQVSHTDVPPGVKVYTK